MIEVQKLKLDATKRLIITSDIHADIALFKNLLEKVDFKDDDYLIINGDLCEKGPDSLGLVHYIRTFIQEHPTIFLTKGNCDVAFRYVLEEDEEILPYMRWRKNSLLHEMMAKHGKSMEDFSSLAELADYYRTYFSQELAWLESLPTAYELEDYLIVHAGIENRIDWRKTEETNALYIKAFHESGHQADKTVIVGHWPVVNYRADQVSSHNPLIDHKKRIISIDGGNQIKKDGQLNALIIENGKISHTFVDALDKQVVVKRAHQDTTNRVGTVTYPNYEMHKLEQEEYFTLCENRNVSVKQWIKNEYLVEKDNTLFCRDDLSTTFLSVDKNEIVKMVDDSCAGYVLVKKFTGEVGWIPVACLYE
ncbi:metallophosphoesterase [Ornithinibacillus contaminans]|uniref:metallophosphoesterase n=1 Tax=Ornithinibacillus contaminans TaxID=694055 RepID=UPI00064E09F2|nr:metallophosphoesterase [Ornithinibacillus contaminans]